MIKIDVEGFEFPVLRGLETSFQSTEHRPLIICEIAPKAYPLLNYSLSQLQSYMRKYSYRAFHIQNTNMDVDITKLTQTTDVIFRPCHNLVSIDRSSKGKGKRNRSINEEVK